MDSFRDGPRTGAVSPSALLVLAGLSSVVAGAVVLVAVGATSGSARLRHARNEEAAWEKLLAVVRLLDENGAVDGAGDGAPAGVEIYAVNRTADIGGLAAAAGARPVTPGTAPLGPAGDDAANRQAVHPGLADPEVTRSAVMTRTDNPFLASRIVDRTRILWSVGKIMNADELALVAGAELGRLLPAIDASPPFSRHTTPAETRRHVQGLLNDLEALGTASSGAARPGGMVAGATSFAETTDTASGWPAAADAVENAKAVFSDETRSWFCRIHGSFEALVVLQDGRLRRHVVMSWRSSSR